MHIVEVWRRGADLANIMAQMRTWADHHRAQPRTFEVGFVGGGEVRFRLGFGKLNEAAAFARAFDGNVSMPSETIVAA